MVAPAFDLPLTPAGVLGLIGLLAAASLAIGRHWRPPAPGPRDPRRSDLILNAINDIVLVIDAHGRIRDVNRRACEFYGLTPAELAGRPVVELRVEAERTRHPDMMARLDAAGQLQFETIHVAAGGRPVPVEVNSRVEVLGDERAFVSVVRDVGAHKAAEARILRLNRTLRTLSEIDQLIVREEDPDRLLARICEAAVTFGGFSMAWLGRAEPDGHVRVLASAGDREGYLHGVSIRWDGTEAGRGPTGTAIREGRTVAVERIAAEPGYAPLWQEAAACSGFESSIATPIRVRGERFGSLNLYSAEPQAMDRELLDLVEELASDIGFALQTFEDRRRLRESERRLANAQRMAHLGGYGYDLAEDRLVWSDEVYRIFGLDRSAFGGRVADFFARVHPDDADLVRQIVADAFADGLPRDFEHRIVRPGGEVRVVRERFESERGPDRRVVRSSGAVQDVTERRRAEAERDALLDRLRLQFERLPIPFLLTGPDLTILEWNPAAERVFGFTRDEAVGRSPFSLIAREGLRPLFEPFVRELAGTDRTLERVNENLTKNGRVIECEWHDTPLRDADGTLIGFMAMAQDLTERRRADAQLDATRRELVQAQKMEAIGRLAGGIAHDFNNLLTAVLGYAAFLLERHPPGDPERDDLEEIRRAGERAARLTEQLLAFSRRQILEPKVLDLNETVAGLARLLGRVIGEDIDLVTHQAGELGLVIADPGRLDQVLMDLAVNARDAMPDGGRLTIETGNVDVTAAEAAAHPEIAPGAYVCLSVSDTGCGMSAEVRGQIFEPFFTTKAMGKGTGLGLSTVYGIVKQSGGHVEVESAEGAGTTFRIYLPRVPRAADRESAEATTPRGPVRNRTILLVEDDAAVRHLGERLLAAQGYHVLAAADAAGAFRVANGHTGPIHLLLTDVVMPGASGRELAERLTAARPGLKVLYMSRYPNEAVAGLGAPSEGVHLLPKPFTDLTLTAYVQARLDGTGA